MVTWIYLALQEVILKYVYIYRYKLSIFNRILPVTQRTSDRRMYNMWLAPQNSEHSVHKQSYFLRSTSLQKKD